MQENRVIYGVAHLKIGSFTWFFFLFSLLSLLPSLILFGSWGNEELIRETMALTLYILYGFGFQEKEKSKPHQGWVVGIGTDEEGFSVCFFPRINSNLRLNFFFFMLDLFHPPSTASCCCQCSVLVFLPMFMTIFSSFFLLFSVFLSCICFCWSVIVFSPLRIIVILFYTCTSVLLPIFYFF